MSSRSAEHHYSPDIDGLRAISIISVVLFHAFERLAPGGYVGVDVFFVISGYLIGGIILSGLAAGSFSFTGFYKRRIRRLLPALAVVYLATIILGGILLAPRDFQTLTYTLRASVLFASNFIFAARTGYFDQAASATPLIHTWSLSVEEQFYLAMPLLLWLIHRRAARLIGPVLVLLAVVSFALAVDGTLRYPAKAFYLPHTRAWELLLGVGLAYFAPLARWGAAARGGAGLAGLLAIVLAIWLPLFAGALDGLARVTLACFGAAALIEAGRYGPSLPSRLLSLGPLTYVGRISYPLYLWHWPLLVFAWMVAGEDKGMASIVAVILAVVLAELTRRFVEDPVRFGRPLPTRTAYIAFAVSALVFVGFSLVNETFKGMPGRFPARVQPVLAAMDEWRRSKRLACMTMSPDAPVERRAAADSPCHIGSAGVPPTVLLWGDSHAAALQPGVDAWLQGRGLAGLVVSTSCVEADYDPDPVFAVECGGVRTRLLQRFLDGPADTLILAMRWNRLVEGPLPLERGYRTLGEAEKSARAGALATMIGKLVDMARQHGKAVVVIDTVPEIPFNVPDTLAVRSSLGLAPPQGPATDDVLARRERTQAAIRRGLAGVEARIVDPVPVFCAQRCRVETGGMPLYFDNNHLGIAARDLVARMLATQLTTP